MLVLRVQSARLYRDQWELEAERSWLAAAIDTSTNEVYVSDAESLRFEYLNSGALTNTGYSMEELAGMTPTDIEPGFTDEMLRAMVGPLLTGERDLLVFDTVHRRKDGTEYPAVVRLQLTERAGQEAVSRVRQRHHGAPSVETELADHRRASRASGRRTDSATAGHQRGIGGFHEELQALYEELAATNEELAATNEDLLRPHEELEISNNETQSLYAGGREAGHELERLNEELAQADSAKNDFWRA